MAVHISLSIIVELFLYFSNNILYFFHRHQLASGGWDAAVKVWSASPEADENDKQFYDPDSISKKKRQKVEQKGIPRVSVCVPKSNFGFVLS